MAAAAVVCGYDWHHNENNEYACLCVYIYKEKAASV